MQEVQAKTTSSEFVEWIHFLDLEVNSFHRENYYLAQIAAEVRRGHVKDPGKVKIDDLILKFENKDPNLRVDDLSPDDRMARSKSFWLATLGMSGKD